jgi:hypothetical protein
MDVAAWTRLGLSTGPAGRCVLSVVLNFTSFLVIVRRRPNWMWSFFRGMWQVECDWLKSKTIQAICPWPYSTQAWLIYCNLFVSQLSGLWLRCAHAAFGHNVNSSGDSINSSSEFNRLYIFRTLLLVFLEDGEGGNRLKRLCWFYE